MRRDIIEQFKWRRTMDIAEKTTYESVGCSKYAQSGSVLIVYDLPHYSPFGLPLYPDFDNYSLPMAFDIISERRGEIDIVMAKQRSPVCSNPRYFCIQWEHLINGQCLQ